MKLKTLFLTLSLFAFVFSHSINLHAQNTPPKPLDINFFSRIEGTWTAKSKMMGQDMNEVLSCRMDLNKQFLIMELQSVSEDKTYSYTGLGIFGSDADGNITSWWFDDWGVNGVSTGTGKIDGPTLMLDAKNPNYTMSRTMKVTDTTLDMVYIVNMKAPDGSDTKIEGETKYTKAK
jgi:hypothetical protein